MTSTRGTSTVAAEEGDLRQHLGLDGARRDDGHAQQPGFGGAAGRGIDQVVALLAAAAPAPPVAAGRGDRAAGELERDRAVDADRPGAAADGEVAARVDQAGAVGGEQLDGAVDRVALGDPAEVEVRPRLELDHGGPRSGSPPPQRAPPFVAGPVRGDELERAVVARRDDGVEDGRVEQPAAPLPCLERQRR